MLLQYKYEVAVHFGFVFQMWFVCLFSLSSLHYDQCMRQDQPFKVTKHWGVSFAYFWNQWRCPLRVMSEDTSIGLFFPVFNFFCYFMLMSANTTERTTIYSHSSTSYQHFLYSFTLLFISPMHFFQAWQKSWTWNHVHYEELNSHLHLPCD